MILLYHKNMSKNGKQFDVSIVQGGSRYLHVNHWL